MKRRNIMDTSDTVTFMKCRYVMDTSDATMENSKIDNSFSQPDKIDVLFQRRYQVAVLGFLCTFLFQSLRVNLSIAIVAVVNSTTTDDTKVPLNGSTECPANFYNSSDTVPSKGEYDWSPELQGYIISAGFLGSFISQIPGGILAKKFGAKRVIVAGLLIPSLSNLFSPVAARKHPYILLALSFIRGLSQGVIPAAMAVMTSKWFPRTERGFLSSLCYCGLPMGAFVTGLVGGSLCDLDFLGGWPLVFYVFGSFGVLVAVLFMIFFADEPDKDLKISQRELNHIRSLQEKETQLCDSLPPTPWLTMLTSVPTVALIIALFGIQWMNFYLVSVHTLYLGTVLHLPIRQNGYLIGGSFAVTVGMIFFTSFMSFWINQHTKLRIDTIRKGFNSLSCIGFSIGLLGVYFSKCNILLNGIFLYIASGSTSLSFVGSFITANDMSPTYCGPLFGFSNTMGNLAGFFVPLMAGKLTNEGQNLTQWGKVFFVSTGIALGCGMIFQFLGSAEIQRWDPAFDKNKQKRIENEAHRPEKESGSCRL